MEKQPDITTESYAAEAEHPIESGTQRVVVDMTQEEFDNLDGLGPDNEAVQTWLEAHGIDPSGTFVARIEGKPDSVVDASPNDFLTRIRDESAIWNEAQAADRIAADAARSLVAIEEEVDSHSVEIAENAEHEPARMTEEEVRDLGEEGLESSGVEEPETDETEQERRTIELIYNRAIAQVCEGIASGLQPTVSALENGFQQVQTVERVVIEEPSDSLKTLIARINSGNYPDDAIRTELKGTIDKLYRAKGQAQQLSEYSLGDATSALKRISEAFDEFRGMARSRDADMAAVSHITDESQMPERTATNILNQAAALVDDEGAFKKKIEDFSTQLNSLWYEKLVRGVDHLNTILEDSYRTPLHIDELRDTANTLLISLQNDELRASLRAGRDAYEPMVDHVKASIGLLLTEAQH